VEDKTLIDVLLDKNKHRKSTYIAVADIAQPLERNRMMQNWDIRFFVVTLPHNKREASRRLQHWINRRV